MAESISRPRWRRWLAIAAAVWLLPQLAIAPLLAFVTLSPPRRPLPADAAARALAALPAGTRLEDLTISAADGAVLRGWYLSPAVATGPAVIALHGMGDNRLGMLGHASYLLAAGHPVLVPDGRAQGASGGTVVTYGVLEADDMRRWARAVSGRRPGCVDALGESLGAAVVLQAATAFCAVVAEAPFESFREVAMDRVGQRFHVGPWVGRLLFRLGLETTLLLIRLREGIDLGGASPVESIRGSQVPILIVHGDADDNIPRRHCVALQQADPAVRFIEVPGAGHTAAHAVAGKAFEDWVIDWFDPAAHSPH